MVVGLPSKCSTSSRQASCPDHPSDDIPLGWKRWQYQGQPNTISEMRSKSENSCRLEHSKPVTMLSDKALEDLERNNEDILSRAQEILFKAYNVTEGSGVALSERGCTEAAEDEAVRRYGRGNIRPMH